MDKLKELSQNVLVFVAPWKLTRLSFLDVFELGLRFAIRRGYIILTKELDDYWSNSKQKYPRKNSILWSVPLLHRLCSHTDTKSRLTISGWSS